MRHIGLTGGIGSGKSTIAGVLEHMGYPVFYSDEEAKKLRTILGLKEYSRAEVIFRNGKHMVVKNTIKEIIEKK